MTLTVQSRHPESPLTFRQNPRPLPGASPIARALALVGGPPAADTLVPFEVIRERFTIQGFAPTPVDQDATVRFAIALPPVDLPAELAKHFRQSGLAPAE